MDDKLRLDGNAAAGTLGEVFSFEATTAEYTCEGCGRTDRIGAAMVYEVRQLGTIIRCPSCDNALIRLAHHRGRYRIDLRGVRHLQVEEEVAG
jgi:DNA-directed RNA polymerase subunit RPC12/RpoP